jgi:hypothetical protein
MAPVLYLGHGALALAATFLYLFATRTRRAVRFIALLGCALGIALVVGADDIGMWRTTTPSGAPGAIAGAAAGAAWLIVAVRPGAGPRPAIVTGVAGSALALFATSLWIVPTLLFGACALMAIAALVSLGAVRSLAWFSVAGVGAAIVVSLGFAAWDAHGWGAIEPEGLYRGLAYGAAIAAAGILPLLVWQAVGVGSGAVPLLAGCGFVLLARIGGDPDPRIAAGLLILALALAAGAWISRLTIVAVGAWSSATFAALAFATRDAIVITAIAAVVAVAAIALWPYSRGRGRLSRGLILSFAPPTVAFAAVVAAEARAFSQATSAASSDGAWAAVAALLPLVLAAGVIIGCGAARTGESDDFEPEVVLGTWGLLVAAVVGGAFLQAVVTVPPVVAHTSVPFVYPLALVAGIVVAVRTPSPVEAAASTDAPVAIGVLALPKWLDRTLTVVAAVLGVGAVAAVGWLTLEGLSVGFL